MTVQRQVVVPVVLTHEKLQGSGPHLVGSMGSVPNPGRIEKRIVGTLVKAFFFRGRRGKTRDPPGHLDTQSITFVGNSGARLVGEHIRTPQPKGIVVLAHPDRRYGRHWFAREGWLDFLTDAGYDALVFDFAVYGDSRGGSTYLHEDVEAACRKAEELRPHLPVHVIGLSIGAFATINALVQLPNITSAVLESPYPTFDAWYAEASTSPLARANRLMARVFARTYARIDAGKNIGRIEGPRLLIAATKDDAVTPVNLTREVARRAPPGTQYLEITGQPHLHLFADATYRKAILAHLAGMSGPATPVPP